MAKMIVAEGQTAAVSFREIELAIAKELKIGYGLQTSKVPGKVIIEIGDQKPHKSTWPIKVAVRGFLGGDLVSEDDLDSIKGEIITSIYWDEYHDNLFFHWQVVLDMPRWAEPLPIG